MEIMMPEKAVVRNILPAVNEWMERRITSQ